MQLMRVMNELLKLHRIDCCLWGPHVANVPYADIMKQSKSADLFEFSLCHASLISAHQMEEQNTKDYRSLLPPSPPGPLELPTTRVLGHNRGPLKNCPWQRVHMDW